MSINFKLEEYRNWLEKNVTLSDPFSPVALRRLTHHLLMGKNYRLLTESNTKGQLFASYLWLSEIKKEAKNHYGDNWIKLLFENIYSEKKNPKELKNLLLWIMGITQKTAINLGLKKNDFPGFIDETINYFNELFDKIGRKDFKDDAWLLLMAGSATLNIRGSQKAKIGKHFEKVFIRSLLHILGLKENENFWMNIERDLEVDREADAEVESKRGRIRIEMGLIASGNQEVIEDKIARVGRNGIILFDILGSKTRVYQTAENSGVKLIQIRNCNPLLDVYKHLQPLVRVGLKKVPETLDEIKKAVDDLPDEIFDINMI
ncbi:CfrBI family restriction endonuclease [candidate division KSB1 bacterium]|nr:CfrBI family restriction endonuclease [candidate division KSB1 bacterium]